MEHIYHLTYGMLKYVPHERAIWILFGLNVIRYLLALENWCTVTVRNNRGSYFSYVPTFMGSRITVLLLFLRRNCPLYLLLFILSDFPYVLVKQTKGAKWEKHFYKLSSRRFRYGWFKYVFLWNTYFRIKDDYVIFMIVEDSYLHKLKFYMEPCRL